MIEAISSISNKIGLVPKKSTKALQPNYFRVIVTETHVYLSIFFSATSVDPCPCPSAPCECPCSPPILSIMSINRNPVSSAKPTY